MPLFRRRQPDEEHDPADVFAGLRANVLRLDPAEVGLAPTEAHPVVFGVVMETGYPEGAATLVALADGTTSLYLQGGGGVIGAGEHPQVAEATHALVQALAGRLDELEPRDGEDLPGVGRVVLWALTYDGRRAAEADEDDLGHDRHPLSPVFHAAHEVIGRVRLAQGG